MTEVPDALIDRIYEAGLSPDLWPAVLDDVARFVDGIGAVLMTFREQRPLWISSPPLAHGTMNTFASAAAAQHRGERIVAARHASFVTEADLFAPDEGESQATYSERMRPRGFGWWAATTITLPNGDTLLFDIERSLERGPLEAETLEALDVLRPHLVRAATLSSRLGGERARGAVEVLAALGMPAAVLRRSGKLLVANDPFTALMPKVAREGRERLMLADPAADTHLLRLLAGVERLGGLDGSTDDPGIAIPARGETPARVLHLVEMSHPAQEVFIGANWVLIATAVLPRATPAAELLMGLFDLTPSEARVARLVADGRTVEQIAASLGLSRETVRTHLKGALAKVGVNRQVELVRLLAAISPGR